MRVRIRPGGRLAGELRVPGDKSIAHRWLILAATGVGRSLLGNMTDALDVRSTALCLGALIEGDVKLESDTVVEGHGRTSLRSAAGALDCGNSGSTIRLLAGVVAAAPFRTVFSGDESLMTRPMERVAEPLRLMGADVRTTEGHPPLEVAGADLHGISYEPAVPTAQVKGAVLLAGLAAEGETTVRESVTTRDHTERALGALGAPVRHEETSVTVAAYQHGGFEGRLPGDVSGAAYVVAAAALTGSDIVVTDIGLNPSRTHFLEVLQRMGVRTKRHVRRETVGEPAGDLEVAAPSHLRATTVSAQEFPLVVDEVLVLATMAAFADGESRFEGLGELRVKESDRLAGVVAGIGELGGEASIEGDDLVVAGGGLSGGRADARRDHRLAMALAVGALAAQGVSEIEGMEWADVTFPGFVEVLSALGANVEVL